MPNTGNQGNVLRNNSPEDDSGWPVQQMISLLNGYYGAPVKLTAFNNSSVYSLVIRNLESTNSRGLQVLDDVGNVLLDVRKGSITLLGRTTGNGNGEIPVNNGTVNTNLNADMLDGRSAGNGLNEVAINNGTVNTNLNADLLDGHDSSYFAVAGDAMATGGYTGNGSTSLRSISTPWTPRYVVVQGGNSDATVELINILSTSGAAYDDNVGNVRYTSAVKLGSTGAEFFVGDGSATPGNVNTRGYTWVAFK